MRSNFSPHRRSTATSSYYLSNAYLTPISHCRLAESPVEIAQGLNESDQKVLAIFQLLVRFGTLCADDVQITAMQQAVLKGEGYSPDARFVARAVLHEFATSFFYKYKKICLSACMKHVLMLCQAAASDTALFAAVPAQLTEKDVNTWSTVAAASNRLMSIIDTLRTDADFPDGLLEVVRAVGGVLVVATLTALSYYRPMYTMETPLGYEATTAFLNRHQTQLIRSLFSLGRELPDNLRGSLGGEPLVLKGVETLMVYICRRADEQVGIFDTAVDNPIRQFNTKPLKYRDYMQAVLASLESMILVGGLTPALFASSRLSEQLVVVVEVRPFFYVSYAIFAPPSPPTDVPRSPPPPLPADGDRAERARHHLPHGSCHDSPWSH